jgi:hypothetical protein
VNVNSQYTIIHAAFHTWWECLIAVLNGLLDKMVFQKVTSCNSGITGRTLFFFILLQTNNSIENNHTLTSQYKQINFKQAQAHIHTHEVARGVEPQITKNRSFWGLPKAECNQLFFWDSGNAHVHPLLELCHNGTSKSHVL